VSISDLVADVRAATPTAAAELITPVLSELCEQIDLTVRRVARSVSQVVDRARHALDRNTSRQPLARPLGRIEQLSQQLDESGHRLALGLARTIGRHHAALARAAAVVARFGAGAEFARIGRALEGRVHRLQLSLERMLSGGRRRAMSLDSRTTGASPAHRLAQVGERLREATARADRAAGLTLDRARLRLHGRIETLVACDPRRILGRGYSITRDARSGSVLRSLREITAHMRITTELADGEFRATTDDPRQPRLFE
jgi:exodeoxyribonuclease VII large subunit